MMFRKQTTSALTRATLGAGLALALGCGTAGAQDLNQLKGILGGGSSSSSTSSLASKGSGSLGNATGILEYCVKNNYLSGSGASSMKDQLMSKLSGSTGQPAQKNSDYLSGAKGILKTGDGNSLDLSSGSGGLQDQIRKQACDTVMKQAKSFL
jgi:hypothetical protein